MLRDSIILFVAMIIQFTAVAQNKALELESYFAQVRSGVSAPFPKTSLHPAKIKGVLAALSPFLRDSSAVVRSEAHMILQLAGGIALEQNVRQSATLKLISGIKDPHTGNAGQVLGYLKAFNKADFNTAAKDTLVNILKRKSSHFDDLIKLIGYLQITQARDDLRGLAQRATTPRNERWAALLALARMGDSYAINDIIARVRRFPVNDEVVYQIFPDLVYTRQRAVFDILVQALNNNEKNCESANPNSSSKMPCGYRIMEMLAPAIQDYPYQVDESGDIITDNYEEALVTVRDWFNNNPDYTILTDRY